MLAEAFATCEYMCSVKMVHRTRIELADRFHETRVKALRPAIRLPVDGPPIGNRTLIFRSRTGSLFHLEDEEVVAHRGIEPLFSL